MAVSMDATATTTASFLRACLSLKSKSKPFPSRIHYPIKQTRPNLLKHSTTLKFRVTCSSDNHKEILISAIPDSTYKPKDPLPQPICYTVHFIRKPLVSSLVLFLPLDLAPNSGFFRFLRIVQFLVTLDYLIQFVKEAYGALTSHHPSTWFPNAKGTIQDRLQLISFVIKEIKEKGWLYSLRVFAVAFQEALLR